MTNNFPKIHCITFNPAIDEVIHVDKLELNAVNKARRLVEYPAGKGFNVARALRCLGESPIVYGLVDNTYLESFRLAFPHNEDTVIGGQSRTRKNLTIVAKDDGSNTHIKTPSGAYVSSDFQKIITLILANITLGDFIIVSGSFLPETNFTEVQNFIRALEEIGANIVFDLSGNNLKNLENSKCDIIKPNLQELEEYVGNKIDNLDYLLSALNKNKLVAKTVVVTLGAAGSILIDRSQNRVVLAEYITEFDNDFAYSVGAGDSFLAGFLASTIKNDSKEVALMNAMVCGFSSLYEEIPGILQNDKHEEIKNNIKIKTDIKSLQF